LRSFFFDSKDVDYTDSILNDDNLVIAINYSPRLLEDYFQELVQRVKSGRGLTIIALERNSKGYEYVMKRDEEPTHIPANLDKIERKVREIRTEAGGTVTLVRHASALSYSFVATKRIIWFKLYRNSAGTSSVPAFCVGQNTELFKFLSSDIQGMVDRGRRG
jgi:hypothetical protein